jgi:hypothetical protein
VTERQPGSDPIGELQRWLVRSGARSVSRQLGDQVRTALGGSNSTHGDVWESATADHEAPECQWCPICRARRRLRESGPGLSSTVAAAGDAVSVVLQDAVTAFEAAVAAAGRQARPRDDAPADGAVWDEVTDEPASGGVWDQVTGEPVRPRPHVLPDPPAEPGGPAGPADPWVASADPSPESDGPAGPSAGPAGTAGTDSGPSATDDPGEQNPT